MLTAQAKNLARQYGRPHAVIMPAFHVRQPNFPTYRNLINAPLGNSQASPSLQLEFI